MNDEVQASEVTTVTSKGSKQIMAIYFAKPLKVCWLTEASKHCTEPSKRIVMSGFRFLLTICAPLRQILAVRQLAEAMVVRLVALCRRAKAPSPFLSRKAVCQLTTLTSNSVKSLKSCLKFECRPRFPFLADFCILSE